VARPTGAVAGSARERFAGPGRAARARDAGAAHLRLSRGGSSQPDDHCRRLAPAGSLCCLRPLGPGVGLWGPGMEHRGWGGVRGGPSWCCWAGSGIALRAW